MLAVSAITVLAPLLDALSVPVGSIAACSLPVLVTDPRDASARTPPFTCAGDIGCTSETG